MMSLVRAQQGEPENPVAKCNGIFFGSPFSVGLGPRHHDSKTERPPPFEQRESVFTRHKGARRSVSFQIIARAPGANHSMSLGLGFSLCRLGRGFPPSGSTKRHHDSKTPGLPPFLLPQKRFQSAVRAPGAPFRCEIPPGRPAQIIRCRPSVAFVAVVFHILKETPFCVILAIETSFLFAEVN